MCKEEERVTEYELDNSLYIQIKIKRVKKKPQ